MTTGGNVLLFGITCLAFVALSNGVKTEESHPLLASLFRTADAARNGRKEVKVIKKPDVKPPVTRGSMLSNAMCSLCKDQSDLVCIKRHCVQPGHVSKAKIPQKVKSTPTRAIVKPPLNVVKKTPAVSCSFCHQTNDPECIRKHCSPAVHIPKHHMSSTFPKDLPRTVVPPITHGAKFSNAMCNLCKSQNDQACIKRHCGQPGHVNTPKFPQKVKSTPTRAIVKPPVNVVKKTPAVSCSFCHQTNDPECIRKHCSPAVHIPKHHMSSTFPNDLPQIVVPPVTHGAMMSNAMCSLCKELNDPPCIKRHCVQSGHVITPENPQKVKSTPTRATVKPPLNVVKKTPAVSCSSCHRTNDPECIRKHCSPAVHIPEHHMSSKFPKEVHQVAPSVFGVIAAQALCSRCQQLNDLACIQRHCVNTEVSSTSNTQQKGSNTLFTDQSKMAGHQQTPISPQRHHPSSQIHDGQQLSLAGDAGQRPFFPRVQPQVHAPPPKMGNNEQVHAKPSTGIVVSPHDQRRVPTDRETFIPLSDGPTTPSSIHIKQPSLPVQPRFPSMTPVALPSNNVQPNIVQPPRNNVPRRVNDQPFRPISLTPESHHSRVDSSNPQTQTTDSRNVIWGDNDSQGLPIDIIKSEIIGPIIQGIEPQQQDNINLRPSNSNQHSAVETVQNVGNVGTGLPVESIPVFNDNQNNQQSEIVRAEQGIPIEISNIETFSPTVHDVEPRQQQQSGINIHSPNLNQRNAVETFVNTDASGTHFPSEGIPLFNDNQNNQLPVRPDFVPIDFRNDIPVEPRTDSVAPSNQVHVPIPDGRGAQTQPSGIFVPLPEQTGANPEMQGQLPQSTNTAESNRANITHILDEFFPANFIETNDQNDGQRSVNIPAAENIFASPIVVNPSPLIATGGRINEGSHSQIVESGSQIASNIPAQSDFVASVPAISQQHITNNQEQASTRTIPRLPVELNMVMIPPFEGGRAEQMASLALRNDHFLNLGPGLSIFDSPITSSTADSAPSSEIQNPAPADQRPVNQPIQSNANVNSGVEFSEGVNNNGVAFEIIPFDSDSNLSSEQSFESTTVIPTISPVRRRELNQISNQFLQGFRVSR